MQIGFRQAKTVRHDHPGSTTGLAQRTAHRRLRSLPYRVAGMLLLLYAQPLTKIAALQTTAIIPNRRRTRIALGQRPDPGPGAVRLPAQLPPSPPPQPAHRRRSRRHPWLFPSNRPGRHIDPQAIMIGSGSSASTCKAHATPPCRNSLSEMPAPLVAEMLGYSDQVTQKHAAEGGNTWSRHVNAKSVVSK